MTGTIRTFDEAVKRRVNDSIRRIATKLGEAHGAEVSVEIGAGLPVTHNDEALTARMLPTLQRVYGAEQVRVSPLITGAEDFSEYQLRVPGFFFFIGGRPADVPVERAIPNHSPFFTADEGALGYGVRAMSGLAVDFLHQP